MDYCTVCAGLVTNIRWTGTSTNCYRPQICVNFPSAQSNLQHLLKPQVTNASENAYPQGPIKGIPHIPSSSFCTHFPRHQHQGQLHTQCHGDFQSALYRLPVNKYKGKLILRC